MDQFRADYLERFRGQWTGGLARLLTEGSLFPGRQDHALTETAPGHHLLRLDRWLGWFLDSLAAQVSKERFLLVLTADHGIVPFPEMTSARGGRAGRLSLVGLIRETRGALASRWGTDFDLSFDSGLLTADVVGLRAHGIDLDSLAAALAVRVGRPPGVARVDTPRSLREAPTSDLIASRWRRSLPQNLGWLICVTAEPGYIWGYGPGSTDHGTPDPDDVNAPIGFMGPGVRPGVHYRPIRTVDIAPSLAALLGLHPGERVDGEGSRRWQVADDPDR